jgi:glycosyltransferase involved in cell wall biosynthesis
MPRVSVIIPTYNRSMFLRAAIASVLGQTFQDFEIVVIDNGSKDDIQEIVTEFKDRRIKCLRITTNNGVSPARNLGIQNSNGKYVAFLDDDDEWLPTKLERQISKFENGPSIVGGVYTGYTVVDRNTGRTIGEVMPQKRGSLVHDLCITNYVGTASTVVLRRDCFNHVGLFDESIGYAEEYDLWIRISREFHFDYVQASLVKYSFHGNNASSNVEHVIKGCEALDRKYGSVFAANSKGYSYFHRTMGELYCYTGDTRKGRKMFFKAIRMYPFSFKHYLYLYLSFLGTTTFRRFMDTMLKIAIRKRQRCYMRSHETI